MLPDDRADWVAARARLVADGIVPDAATEAVLRNGYPSVRALIDAVHGVADADELDGLLIVDTGDARRAGQAHGRVNRGGRADDGGGGGGAPGGSGATARD